MKELQVAKQIIINNLNSELTFEGLGELWEITNGNKEILLEHIKALSNIFNKAKEQLEKDLKENK